MREFISDKYQNINIKVNKELLDKILTALDGILSLNKNFSSTLNRNALFHVLLTHTIESKDSFITLDGKSYTFQELYEIGKKGTK